MPASGSAGLLWWHFPNFFSEIFHTNSYLEAKALFWSKMQSNFFPNQFHYLWIDQMLGRNHIKNVLSQTLKHSYSALLLATRRNVLFKYFLVLSLLLFCCKRSKNLHIFKRKHNFIVKNFEKLLRTVQKIAFKLNFSKITWI